MGRFIFLHKRMICHLKWLLSTYSRMEVIHTSHPLEQFMYSWEMFYENDPMQDILRLEKSDSMKWKK